MKNIYLLNTEMPTDGIVIGRNAGVSFTEYREELIKLPVETFRGNYYEPVNIYITSEDKIELNDYIVDNWQVEKWKDRSSLLGKKKVIMTTDKQLISERIQEVDDGFLDWIIQNHDTNYIKIEEYYDEKYDCIMYRPVYK